LAGKWDYSVINQIQQANDIVDVISEHLKLEKKGKEMVGLCPFHTDQRPSMYVNPAKQIFKCFACGAGGDVLKFIQMKENLTFPQAVERLAHRAGIALEPVYSRRSDSAENSLDGGTLAKINTWALNHWVSNLADEQKGAAARDYIKQRQISEESAKKWQLGLAIDAWDDLVGKASAKKDAAKSLVTAGLAVEKERGGCYDKFRNRLMFPIVDVTGRVIGFGGRTLGDDPAKYMNSPATALFDKSHSLYGLNMARAAISDSGTVIVAEGYTDVMMAHQFGIENVVAALGTSLTSGHARILRRYAKRIVLLFDSDIAGRSASNRALEVCLSEKIAVQIAFVPDGKDPCEFLLESGADALKAVIESAQDVLEFKWTVLEEQLSAEENLSDRTEAIRQFLQIAATAFESRRMDSVSRTVVVSRLSELLKIPSSRIEEEMVKIQKQRMRAKQDQANQPIEAVDVPQETQAPTLLLQAQREVLEVLLHEPRLYGQVADKIGPADFCADQSLAEIAGVLLDCLSQGVEASSARLYGQIESPAAAAALGDLEAVGGQKGDAVKRLTQAIEVIEQYRQIHAMKQSTSETDEDLLRRQQLAMQKGGNRRTGGMIY
jgi:DNA primase